MLSRKLNILSLALGLVLAQSALGSSDLTVNSGEGAVNPLADMSVAGATQRTTTNNYTIRFRASCFGTNLRGVANPIAPNSTVIMKGKVLVDNGSEQELKVRFPASAVLGTGAAATQTGSLSGFTLPAGSRAAYSGNTVTINIPSTVTNTVDPVTAQISVAQQRFQVSGISFDQEAGASNAKGEYCFIGSCSFYAYNGQLSSSAINISQSSDGKTFDIETGFPGQEGYCGGYHSPLMVFLDKKIPKFNNVVEFNMGGSERTYWPEKNHAGYFVALPNKQGKVTSNEELFGQTSEYKNGFEKLAVHDLNKDGVIDGKDPVFKKLVLWKDKSGKAVYSKKDTIPLASLIKSINLKFEPRIEAVSEKVEFREKSTIVLKDPKKYPHAYIVDVWFQPYTSALTAN